MKNGGKKKGMTLTLRQNIVGYSFILPNFIGFFIFIFVPVLFSLLLSFSHWDGFNPIEFAGLENFIDIFKDKVFTSSIFKTLYFSLFTVIFSMAASLRNESVFLCPTGRAQGPHSMRRCIEFCCRQSRPVKP